MSNSGIIGPRQTITGATAGGINNLTDAQVLKGAGVWPTAPNAPTSVSATSGGNTTSVISFTASTDAGSSAITGYRVTSTPSGLTATGSASPITITGLTNGTAYTFTVAAQNAVGFGAESASSGSATPVTPQQVAYTSAGTYSFVVPAGLSPNTLAVVLVGAGGSSGYAGSARYGGGGGGLRYRNNITAPSAGTSISVVVGAAAYWNDGNDSTFGTSSDAYYLLAGKGFGGTGTSGSEGLGGTGTSISGDVGGGNGGSARYSNAGGGGAGGYSGSGGDASQNGSGGGGGGGENGSGNVGGGGGVGLLGQGSNGDGGSSSSLHGKGGSGGTDGTSGTSGYTAGGGTHGGGAGGNYAKTNNFGLAGTGGARIIYSTTGLTRAFPTTQTGDV